MHQSRLTNYIFGGLCMLLAAGLFQSAQASTAQEMRSSYEQMQGALASSPLLGPLRRTRPFTNT